MKSLTNRLSCSGAFHALAGAVSWSAMVALVIFTAEFAWAQPLMTCRTPDRSVTVEIQSQVTKSGGWPHYQPVSYFPVKIQAGKGVSHELEGHGDPSRGSIALVTGGIGIAEVRNYGDRLTLAFQLSPSFPDVFSDEELEKFDSGIKSIQKTYFVPLSCSQPG